MEKRTMKEALQQLDQDIDDVITAFAEFFEAQHPAEDTESETEEDLFTDYERNLIHYNMLGKFVEIIAFFTERQEAGIYDTILRAVLQDK